MMVMNSLQNYLMNPNVSIQLWIQQSRHCHLFFQQQMVYHLVSSLLFKDFCNGIFEERPSLPRYTVTFDVNPVFEWIKEIACSDNTSLEIFTKILATIMCLLSGQRSLTLSLL